ncbi:MAG: NAD(+)/NADH kinase [Elusimicrobiota bacterium]
MKKAAVFYNSNNKENIKILNNLEKILNKRKIELIKICVLNKCFNNIKADFAISIGGDGTVLYASHYLVKNDIPLIAIKGGGLGFLGSIDSDEAEKFIVDYLNNNYKIINRTLLEVKIRDKTFIALNDCVIKSMDLRTFYTKIYFSNEYISTYFSDGIIISTPTGSTAYNLSAGGPIAHPHSRIILLTPISPHTLTHRPVVLPDTAVLNIKAIEKTNPTNPNIIVAIDGQQSVNLKTDEVKIFTHSKSFKTIVAKNYSYFEVLRKKLSWGERDEVSVKV